MVGGLRIIVSASEGGSVTPRRQITWFASVGLLLTGALLAGCGSSGPKAAPTTTTTLPGLAPTALGEGQCQASTLADGSSYGQIAIASGATCTTAAQVATGASAAAGASYSADGYSCTGTVQGPSSEWASSWGGTYYSYSCADGSSEVAFNWGEIYTYDSVVGSPSSNPLSPAPLGQGQCQAASLPGGSVYAQIAVSDAACDAVAYVAKGAPAAAGANYQSNGYSCVGTKEGAGSKWASAWGGTYYAYRCTFGKQRLAFTWGTDYTYG